MPMKVLLTGIVAVLLALSSACAPAVAPTALPSPTPQDQPARQKWETDWEKTLAEAKQEGTVIIYTTASSSTRQALADEIRKKFGLDLEFVSGRGNEVVEKISAERRAGLYLADLYIGGATTPTTSFKPMGYLAPHPNATTVFVNWFLSKEGQTLYSMTALAESARLDVPTDHLDKGDLRVPGIKYFMSEDEDFLIKKVEYENKWAKEVFAPLLK